MVKKTEKMVGMTVNPDIVDNTVEAVAPNTSITEKSGQKTSLVLVVTLVIVFGSLAGVLGFYAGKKSTPGPVGTPTPTPLVTTEAATEVPTLTDTPLSTATVTPTSTTATVSKTAAIKEFGGDFTLNFTLQVPEDVTVTETKVSSWNGIVLRRGPKAFMAFNLPYELYEIQGYSSVTPVTSSTISDLRRVRSKKVFANSGTYSFAVAYVTPGMLVSGKDCTEPVISDATTSPCATPALRYSDQVGFSAYCSVDPVYIKICDEVMKTVKVVKE